MQPQVLKVTFYPSASCQVEQSKVLIREGGVQLLLTIVDTPGFGDAVDNSNWSGFTCLTHLTMA